MFESVTPEQAISFTHRSVMLACCWPPSETAKRSEVLFFRVLRFFAALNALILFFPSVYSLYVNRGDFAELSKTVCICSGIAQVVIQTVFCAFRYEQFQRVVTEMGTYVKHAKAYERGVFQKYITQYSTFYVVSSLWLYLSATVIVVGTLFLPQPFPTNAEYPFYVNFEPLRTIIFLHQTVVGMQCSAHGCLNVMGALLMLFVAARFEILSSELSQTTDVGELIKCIEKYYHLRRYAQDMADAVKFIALMSTMFCGLGLVFCGLNIIGEQPVTVKVQFFILAGTALAEVFMCAWPADRLIDNSQNVAYGAYQSMWYGQSLKLQRFILCTLMPQKGITLSIKCVMPVLSLRFYCSYISNMFSFFTALRIMMIESK